MLNVYFGGELFDHKHLIGNYMLVHVLNTAVQSSSPPIYKFNLPQDTEVLADERTSLSIRDKDYTVRK